jgi:hypothetical protein
MAMNANQFCEKFIQNAPLASNMINPYNQHRGELLFLARQQLDKIGNLLGHLDNPFSKSRVVNFSLALDEKLVSSNPLLQSIVNSIEIFDKTYTDITVAMITCFNICYRPNTVKLLKLDLGYLELYNQLTLVRDTASQRRPKFGVS